MPAPARPTVLWAEDSAQDVYLIRSLLDAGSPDVRFAADGQDLLAELARGMRPDLVVLDLKMPRMGGVETLRRIRENPAWSSLRVAVFSGGDNLQERQACLGLGAVAVMQKPVNFERFGQAVGELMRMAVLEAGVAR